MKPASRLFTSESVAEGHPDKIADQISDAVLDAILTDDRNGRVACETAVTTGLAIVMGEISTNTYVEIPDIVRSTIRQAGYEHDGFWGFDAASCGVITSIQRQSPDIAVGVNTGGAGDQGMMFGFACVETPELMPLPIQMAHNLARGLARVRKDGTLPYLGPDGKSQVTIEYADGRPRRIHTVVLSAQHRPEVGIEEIRAGLRENVLKTVLREMNFLHLMDDRTVVHINPTGRFVLGGPQADAGLTGRKIIVDTYGGYARHGGGAFSGKDPSKVDRSAAYAARYVAKNLVAAGLAERCEVQVSYAIGVAEPTSIMVETFGTSRLSRERLTQLVRKHFDLTPYGLREMLDLLRPIYQKTATYGHFGRTEPEFTWERTDLAETLAAEAKGARAA